VKDSVAIRNRITTTEPNPRISFLPMVIFLNIAVSSINVVRRFHPSQRFGAI
jgi:hypothetical protein